MNSVARLANMTCSPSETSSSQRLFASLAKTIFSVWGLVDIGEHSPEELKKEVGDHVLEVIFQPFEGAWYQSLGCFVTKDNAKGYILSKIVIEGNALCENAGVFVDGVVTDGATWNRNIWTQFGIDAANCSSEHFTNADRKLWFFSDWCHLLKCMTNNLFPLILKKKKLVPKKF